MRGTLVTGFVILLCISALAQKRAGQTESRFVVPLRIVDAKATTGWGFEFDDADILAADPGNVRLGHTPAGDRVKAEKLTEPQHAYRLSIDTDGDGDLADESPIILRPGGKSEIAIDRMFADARRKLKYQVRYSRGERNGQWHESISWSPMYRAEGTLRVGSQSARLRLSDMQCDGDFDRLDFAQGTAASIDMGDSSESAKFKYLGYEQFFKFAGKTLYVDARSIADDVSSVTVVETSIQIPRLGETLPAPLEVKTLSGRSIDLQALRGKVHLIDFWPSWCAPCVAKLPAVKRMASESNGVEVIYYNTDNRSALDKAKAVISDLKLPRADVVMNGLGDDDPAWRAFRWMEGVRYAVGLYAVLDRDGVVRYVGGGGVDLQDLRAALTQAAKSAGPQP